MDPIASGQRRGQLIFPVLIVVLGLVLVSLAAQAMDRDLEIVGWVERVRLLDPDVLMEAKLDTGAETSSLDVEVVRKFRQGGKRWIRFRMVDRDTGEEHIIVRERLRTVAIVRHDGERQLRPVVRMKFCLAGRVLDTEVSLIDRSEFTYPLLLGRKSLESFALIEPGSTYLTVPVCKPKPEGRSARS
jgi:hypothetical protein